MHSHKHKLGPIVWEKLVLILVVMEDALARNRISGQKPQKYVLILVVMEDALALLSNFQIKEVSGGS